MTTVERGILISGFLAAQRGAYNNSLDARECAVGCMNEELPTWVEVSRTDKRRKVREHALVLQAMGIGHGEVQDGNAVVLLVRAEDGPRAREQLERYERENRAWPPREEAPLPISDGIRAGPSTPRR